MDFRERIQKWHDKLAKDLEDLKNLDSEYSEDDLYIGQAQQLEETLKDTNTKEEEN